MKLFHTQFYLIHFEFDKPKTVTMVAKQLTAESNKHLSSRTYCKFCQSDFTNTRAHVDHMKDTHSSYVDVSTIYVQSRNQFCIRRRSNSQYARMFEWLCLESS